MLSCGCGDFHGFGGLTRFLGRSDAKVVGAPVGDGLLDGFGREVLAEGALDEGGEFGVGGEAERDDLRERERLCRGGKLWREQTLVAEVLFETDDAVLHAGRIGPCDAGEEEERDGHDEKPRVQPDVMRQATNQYDDGDNQIDEKDRSDEEVKHRFEPCVVPVVLRCGHSFLVLFGEAAP